MTTPSTPTKQREQEEAPYFLDCPSITSREFQKEYRRKLLEPFDYADKDKE